MKWFFSEDTPVGTAISLMAGCLAVGNPFWYQYSMPVITCLLPFSYHRVIT